MPSSSQRGSLPVAAAASAGRGWDYAAVAVLAFALFHFAAVSRMVDDDEGYYALAGRAMLSGRIPYRDFFFPQLPLGALAYGVLRPLIGGGLLPLRVFGAVAATATALLVHHAARRVGGRVAGLAAAALFCSHTLVWEWAVTVKTYPLGLLLGTAVLVIATSRVVTIRRAAWVGVLAGLTVAARALSLPIVVACGYALIQRRDEVVAESRVLGTAALGFVVGLLPVVGLFGADPGAFVFDNVGYHAIRSPGDGLVKDVAQKLHAFSATFFTPFGATRPDVTGLQSTALCFSVILAWRASSRSDVTVRGFALAAGLVTVVGFLPSPVWVQYFVAAVPPASVVAGIALARLVASRWLLVAALAAYAGLALPSFADRLVRAPALLRPAAVDAVGRALTASTEEGDHVAAHFPAYLVSSERWPIDPAANQFARLYSDRVTPSERARYHLYTEADFRDALLRHDARAFVVGAFTVPGTALALKAQGWNRASQRQRQGQGEVVLGATIWIANPAPAHTSGP